jgi:hypothetical protein
MSIRPNLTPCIICQKQINYLWDQDIAGTLPHNLDYAVDLEIYAGYGSIHDGDVYKAVICDECLTTLISKNLVAHKGNYIHGQQDQSTTPLT